MMTLGGSPWRTLTGKNNPEFTARMQVETEKIAEEIRSKHGALNIAVDLIRDARDEA